MKMSTKRKNRSENVSTVLPSTPTSPVSPNIIMELRTIQASVIKNLFESIREILVDINIVFTADSIHCTSIDGNKCACVHFRLETARFEQYVCKEESIVVGVNMFSLHKGIKPITNTL